MSKSQRIRDYKAANPESTAPEIQAALKKEKVKVSLPLIYQIFAKKNGRTASPSAPKVRGGVSIETLLEAKKVVAEAGSISEARRALDLLERLTT